MTLLTNDINEIGHNNTLIKNYGIFDGAMLECIYNFYQHRASGINLQHIRAQELLDDIAENILSIDSFDYGYGLAGIGFGIEWLTQNGYINCNTDEVLVDVDDEIYKSVVYARGTDHSLLTGTTGKAYYFYKRLIATNPDVNRYKQICLIECLVLLSDEITDYLIDPENGLCTARALEDISDQNILNMCQIFILFEKLLKRRINTEAVKSGICGILAFIEKYCFKTTDVVLPFNSLPIAYSYAILAELFNDPVWSEKSIVLYQQLPKLNLLNETDDVYLFMHTRLSSIFEKKQSDTKNSIVMDGLASLLGFRDNHLADLMLLK